MNRGDIVKRLIQDTFDNKVNWVLHEDGEILGSIFYTLENAVTQIEVREKYTSFSIDKGDSGVVMLASGVAHQHLLSTIENLVCSKVLSDKHRNFLMELLPMSAKELVVALPEDIRDPSIKGKVSHVLADGLYVQIFTMYKDSIIANSSKLLTKFAFHSSRETHLKDVNEGYVPNVGDVHPNPLLVSRVVVLKDRHVFTFFAETAVEACEPLDLEQLSIAMRKIQHGGISAK